MNEINALFNNLFPNIASNGNQTYDDVIRLIDSLGFSISSKDVFDILLGYSLLVPKDPQSGQLFYSYREQNLHDVNNYVIRLHKSIYHKYKPIYSI